MNICFYNTNHIGDIYFNYFFINLICKQNPDIHFYYYFMNGDEFFEDIKNISKIIPIESTYSRNLINGEPPENLLDNELWRFLKQTMDNISYKKLNRHGKEYLFVNLWSHSEVLFHKDFDFISAISKYDYLIKRLNNDFSMNINFKISENHQLTKDTLSKEYNCEFLNLSEDYLNETTLIFNYKPRSVHFDMNLLNNFILNFSKDNKIILTSYDKIFESNKNITFMDRDYKIYPNPKCDNLLYIWEIAIKCKKIIIVPSGSAFLFFHRLDKIKENQINMFDNVMYYDLLDKNLKFFTNKNLISLLKV